MDITAFFSFAIIVFLTLTIIVAIYYGLLSIDSSSFIGTENTVIPIAVLFLLITNGFFMGNNGFTGDFGLDYCNDKDQNGLATEYYEIVHPESFFACELGYIDGFVDLGWILNVPTSQVMDGEIKVMILNHDNYKNFVDGETYGVSNFHLSRLQAPVDSKGETSKYELGLILHSDTYFFVVDRDYWETSKRFVGGSSNRGLIGPNSPTGSIANPISFHYVVDLDYDTSGVITTN